MRKIIEGCKDMTILDNTITIKSALKPEQNAQIDELVDAISATIPRFEKPVMDETAMAAAKVDPIVMQKFSYGLFVLTAKSGEKDNGCIINTAAQLTSSQLHS